MSKRDDYQQMMEDQLGLWRLRLEARRSKAANNTSVELHEQLEDWRAAGRATAAKLGQLKVASADAWDALKLELDAGWHLIEKVFSMDSTSAAAVRPPTSAAAVRPPTHDGTAGERQAS